IELDVARRELVGERAVRIADLEPLAAVAAGRRASERERRLAERVVGLAGHRALVVIDGRDQRLGIGRTVERRAACGAQLVQRAGVARDARVLVARNVIRARRAAEPALA